MNHPLLERWRQGYRTFPYPQRAPALPARFRGLPRFAAGACPEGCRHCLDACPLGALEAGQRLHPTLDLGRCIFCGDCAAACPSQRLTFSGEYRLAARRRPDLLLDGQPSASCEPLPPPLLKLFGRSLKLRQVSAGGCNACEADANVLNTPGYDLARFGIQFVASPRHADGLLITGPVSQNMRQALLDTWEGTPEPRLVIACGSCAIGGGPYAGHPEVNGGVEPLLKVDLFVPGCPPHPYTLLHGLLALLGRLER